MKYVKIILIGALFVVNIACAQRDPNKQVDEGKVEGEFYTSTEIGWTIEIPIGYEVTARDRMDELTDRGMDAVQEVTGKIDYSGLKHLIGFQKDRLNLFQSTSEPFPLEYEGHWEENNTWIKGVLYDTYAKQGIKADTSSFDAVIDGLKFEGFKSTIYGPSGNVILYQELYSRYINGYDFGAIINYNNKEDRAIMYSVLMSSKFSKRD